MADGITVQLQDSDELKYRRSKLKDEAGKATFDKLIIDVQSLFVKKDERHSSPRKGPGRPRKVNHQRIGDLKHKLAQLSETVKQQNASGS